MSIPEELKDDPLVLDNMELQKEIDILVKLTEECHPELKD